MSTSINGLTGGQNVAMDKSLKANADKAGQNDKVPSTPTTGNGDTLALTPEAKALQQLAKGVTAQTEYFDQGRVDAIKQSIAEGQYAVDSQRVAEKFMETEQLLGKI